MRTIRPYVGAFIALVFAAMTGTVGAQNVKKFDLGAPSTVAVTTTSIQVTFKNLDTGNSSFNSIGIKGTASGGATLTVNSATASPGGPGTPVTNGDGYFYLTGIAPVKKGQTLTVTLNVTITGTGCTNGAIAWHGRAFTGSPSQPSTEFLQNNADPTTAVTKGCSYSATGTDAGLADPWHVGRSQDQRRERLDDPVDHVGQADAARGDPAHRRSELHGQHRGGRQRRRHGRRCAGEL
jgi:hypothetical protein